MNLRRVERLIGLVTQAIVRLERAETELRELAQEEWIERKEREDGALPLLEEALAKGPIHRGALVAAMEGHLLGRSTQARWQRLQRLLREVGANSRKVGVVWWYALPGANLMSIPAEQLDNSSSWARILDMGLIMEGVRRIVADGEAHSWEEIAPLLNIGVGISLKDVAAAMKGEIVIKGGDEYKYGSTWQKKGVEDGNEEKLDSEGDG